MEALDTRISAPRTAMQALAQRLLLLLILVQSGHQQMLTFPSGMNLVQDGLEFYNQQVFSEVRFTIEIVSSNL